MSEEDVQVLGPPIEKMETDHEGSLMPGKAEVKSVLEADSEGKRGGKTGQSVYINGLSHDKHEDATESIDEVMDVDISEHQPSSGGLSGQQKGVLDADHLQGQSASQSIDKDKNLNVETDGVTITENDVQTVSNMDHAIIHEDAYTNLVPVDSEESEPPRKELSKISETLSSNDDSGSLGKAILDDGNAIAVENETKSEHQSQINQDVDNSISEVLEVESQDSNATAQEESGKSRDGQALKSGDKEINQSLAENNSSDQTSKDKAVKAVPRNSSKTIEKGKPTPDDDVIVIDDDDDEPAAVRPKPVRKKSSQAALCKCILCGDMVRLSTLGLHVNSLHSKLIVKGNASIECKVCEEFFTWSNFVDHAQVKHKWSIVKNSTTKAKTIPARVDYENMKVTCIWCKEGTDVRSISSHFKSVHKVDEKVIERAMKLTFLSKDHDKGAEPSKTTLPTGITGALFVTCNECNKDLKFSEVLNHFQLMHKKSKVAPNSGQVVSRPAIPPQRPVTKQSIPQPPKPKSIAGKGEQLITLFKGQLNISKSPNYALVKLAHDGKDKILSIPFTHPIARHKVQTIAVKGALDDIPALIQSVTDLLASQKPPAEPLVPPPVTQGMLSKLQPPATTTTTATATATASKVKQTVAQVDDKKDNKNTAVKDDKASTEHAGDKSEQASNSAEKGSLGKDSSSDSGNQKVKKIVEENKPDGSKKDEPIAPATKSSSEESKKESIEEKTEVEDSPLKSPSKKGSPRGSLSRLLELQRESIGNAAEDVAEEEESSGRPLRRSSRRAKMAAKLKIKSVVEKEIEEWKKLPELTEYVPTEEEENDSKLPANNVIYMVSSSATNHTTSVAAKNKPSNAIEQYIFRQVEGGKKMLVPVGSKESFNKPPGVQITSGTRVTKALPQTRTSVLKSASTLDRGATTPVVGGRLPGTASGQLKVSSLVTKQQKSPARNSVTSTPKLIVPQQHQTSTTTILPSGVTLHSPQLYQQPNVSSGQVVLNQVGSPQGAQYIIQPQQQSLAFMQPTTVLQQGLGGVGNVQVQLQPQTVPVQSPNMMVMQNRLQLVTTPQGQQILLLPSNNNMSQPVVVNQVPQNRMIFSVGPQQSVQHVKQTVVTKAPQVSSPQAAPTVSSVKPHITVIKSTSNLQTEKRVKNTQSSNTDFMRISDLSKEKDGYVCQKADISVKTFKEKVIKNIPIINSVTPVERTEEQVIEAKKAAEEDASWFEDYARVVTISTSRGSIKVSDLPDIPSIMFECSRCGTGLPTHLLLRTHLVDCFDTPPVEEPAYIVRLPFSLLQMFFVTGPEPGGVVSCKLCNKIIPRSGNKDLIPLQAHVREHQGQNTALKGGSVTFGVMSLNKISVLKCKLCGEVILRLWQDITPMGAHLQKHIKGNVEILCNQPPVFGLTSKPHAQHISKKAYTWVDYIVPPFTMENPPISEKQSNLDSHVATAGILHHESLLPRRKRRYQSEPEAPRLRGKSSQMYQSNLKPLIIETSTAETVTSYDIRPGKTNLLHSIKIMPSPNKLKRSTLTASIPLKTKSKTVMAQSSGSDRRKIYRQGPYRSARLQEKRDKYMKEIDEAAEAGSGTDSPLNPSTPVKEQEPVKNAVLPVTCSKSQRNDKPLQATVTTSQAENVMAKSISSATVMLKKFAESQSAKLNLTEQSNKVEAKKAGNPVSAKMPLLRPVDIEKKQTPSSWQDDGVEYVEPVMPPRTPSPPTPETPPPPITEGDISDYLKILDGCDSLLKESEADDSDSRRPMPEIGDVSLSDYFGDSANTSILCEPLIIEQGQAPMYFTRSASTGYRFRCSFSKCEAAVPNNTLVMLAHLSQHFRVRIAGDFSQNGSVVGHRRTCKSLPLTINQVGAHFTLSDKEEASLHAGEVQMAYVCQWRNCNRTRTFKKGLITHLYRHVSFHLISESQHAALKEKSKPLKLSSAQFVPHGSGTKLITESMNSSHGLNFDKSKCPKLLGLLNEKADPDNPQLSQGNYGTGSPLGSLIDKLASQLMKSDGGPSSPLVTIDDSSNKKPSTVPKEGETLSRAAYRKGKFPHYQMGLSVSSPSCGPGPKKIVTPRVPGVSNEKSSKNDQVDVEDVQGKDGKTLR